MDKIRLAEMLGLKPHGSFRIEAIHVENWGSQIRLDALYDTLPPDPPAAFHLMLDDCRDLQWRVYAHLKHPEDQTLQTTLLVNIRLGVGGHHKPLHLLTDSFGLTVSYGTLTLKRLDE